MTGKFSLCLRGANQSLPIIFIHSTGWSSFVFCLQINFEGKYTRTCTHTQLQFLVFVYMLINYNMCVYVIAEARRKGGKGNVIICHTRICLKKTAHIILTSIEYLRKVGYSFTCNTNCSFILDY